MARAIVNGLKFVLHGISQINIYGVVDYTPYKQYVNISDMDHMAEDWRNIGVDAQHALSRIIKERNIPRIDGQKTAR